MVRVGNFFCRKRQISNNLVKLTNFLFNFLKSEEISLFQRFTKEFSRIFDTSEKPQTVSKLPEIKSNNKVAANNDSIRKQQVKRVLQIFNSKGLVEPDTNRLNITDLGTIKISEQLTSFDYIDLTGLESLTDYGVYMLANSLKANEKLCGLINLNGIKLTACSNVSVWSLHYLGVAFGLGMLELCENEQTIRERVAGCKRIDEDTVVMLENTVTDYKG